MITGISHLQLARIWKLASTGTAMPHLLNLVNHSLSASLPVYAVSTGNNFVKLWGYKTDPTDQLLP